MSVESLRNELLRKVVSISQRIYKLRTCLLVSETGRDNLAQGMREISRLEGIQEGIKLSISTIQKHIGPKPIGCQKWTRKQEGGEG